MAEQRCFGVEVTNIRYTATAVDVQRVLTPLIPGLCIIDEYSTIMVAPYITINYINYMRNTRNSVRGDEMRPVNVPMAVPRNVWRGVQYSRTGTRPTRIGDVRRYLRVCE